MGVFWRKIVIQRVYLFIHFDLLVAKVLQQKCMQIFFCTFSLDDVLSQPAGVVLKATQSFLWIVAAAFRL